MYAVILGVAALLLAASFLVTLWAILRGPHSLDRVLGVDGLTAMMQCALATYICWTLNTTVSPAMLVIALLGFISTLSITRWRKRDDS